MSQCPRALWRALSACALFSAACNNPGPPPAASAGSAALNGAAANGGSSAAAVSGAAGVSADAAGAAVVAPAAGTDAASAAIGGSGVASVAGASGTRAGAGAAGSGGSASAQVNSDPAFMNLAPTLGEPLDGKGKDLTPPAPSGWIWYEIDGAVCRDGSATGFYVHTGSADKLLIYLEGGGACSDDHFCAFNPANVNQVLAGDGQTVLGTTLGAIEGRQQPGVYSVGSHDGAPAGIFDFANTDNPFKDWSQIYVPYCTGDVFFGTKKDGTVPGLSGQQFVGYLDMKLFISRIVPTFKDKVSRVILTGASAGGFGAALNYSMVQDSFGSVPVDVIDDSGPPFDDKFMPVCMQKRWRDQWGFDGSLPPDCADCRQADGGGLIKMADFLLKKHHNAHIAIISTMQDEVIRLFYSVGLKDCASYDTADPVGITLGQVLDPSVLMDAQTYTNGLNDLRTKYVNSGQFATFYMGGANPNFHQHIFRPEFYTKFGDVTQAQFVAGFLAGKVEQVGP